jgi:hypothetical protein
VYEPSSKPSGKVLPSRGSISKVEKKVYDDENKKPKLFF